MFSLTGCNDLPRDPEGTLDRVRGGTLRVGAVPAEPWVVLNDAGVPTRGVEVELVEALAQDLDADVQWFEGSEQELFAALELGELDLVIGGITSDNPWQAHATFSRPYTTTSIVVAAPPEADPDLEIAGKEIAVEPGTEAAGLLRKTDAVVVPVDDITVATTDVVVVESWLLDDLGLQRTQVTLSDHDHVMGVRNGENAWLTTLERFLLGREALVHELLEEIEP